jgi:putative phosphoribosyl transferase
MAHDPVGGQVPLTSTRYVFKDRTAAGEQLAERLLSLLARPFVIAAIPRGGIAVALPIVERLRRPLAVVHACKLTAPAAPELAFGAVDEDGQLAVDQRTIARLELGPEVVASAKARAEAEIHRRIAVYKARPLIHYLPGPDVILVDDGLATGLTMHAAVAYARRHGAREIAVVVPCASEEAAARFRQEADRFVSLVVGDAFGAVGGYYADFSPLTDEQVSAMLAGVEDSSTPSGPERRP